MTLSADNEILLGQRGDGGEDFQLWRLDDDGVLHSKTGLVVDIPGSCEDAGVQVIGHGDVHGGDNQKFSFDGSCIKSELNGFVFDIEDGRMEEGAAVIMWPHHGEVNQIFKFVQMS